MLPPLPLCLFAFYSPLCQFWWRSSGLLSRLAAEGSSSCSSSENRRAIHWNEQQVLKRWDVYSISAMSHWSEPLSPVTAMSGFPPEPLLGLWGIFSFFIIWCSSFTLICLHRMSSQVPRHECVINNRWSINLLTKSTQNPPVLFLNHSLRIFPRCSATWSIEICFDISFHKSLNFFFIVKK